MFRGFCVVLVALALFGCTDSSPPPPQVAIGSNHVPTIVAQATKRVRLSTLPIVEDKTNCFPEYPVQVRMINGRVMVDDVSFYVNRKPAIADGLIEYCDDALEKIGFVDSQGRVAIPPRFDYVIGFSGKRAVVHIDSKAGYIKTDGSWLIEPTFEFANSFENGFAAAELNGQYGILNLDGTWHLPPQFIQLDILSGGWYAVRPNGEEGFFDPRRRQFLHDGEFGKSYRPPGSTGSIRTR